MTIVEQAAPEVRDISPPAPLRLEFVDGIRACAALFVVLDHACLESGMSYSHLWLASVLSNSGQHGLLPAWFLRLLQPLMFGHLAVCVFIVVSGYCLSLPLRGFTSTLQVGRFFQKRARRILPTYYAAFVLSLVYIAAFGSTARQHPTLASSNFWLNANIAFSRPVILSHILVVQNSGTWWRHINYPLWSIATECQIYLLFPLLVLLRRRFSMVMMLNGALLTSVLLTVLLNQCHGSMNASPWFVSLFAFGMVAAEKSREEGDGKRWGFAALGLFVFALLVGSLTSLLWDHIGMMDLLAGAISACVLIYCAQRKTYPPTPSLKGRGVIRPLLLRFLESQPLVAIGTFSYSLYLVHVPVLSWCHSLLMSPGLSPLSVVLSLIGVGVGASIAVAYVFHLLFERPFLSQRR